MTSADKRQTIENMIADDAIPSQEFLVDYVLDIGEKIVWSREESVRRIRDSANNDDSLGLYLIEKQDLDREGAFIESFCRIDHFDLERQVVVYTDLNGAERQQRFDRSFFDRYNVFFPHMNDFKGVPKNSDNQIDSMGLKAETLKSRHRTLWSTHFKKLVEKMERDNAGATGARAKLASILPKVSETAQPSQTFVANYIINSTLWTDQRSIDHLLSTSADTPDPLGLYLVKKSHLELEKTTQPSKFVREIHHFDIEKGVVVYRNARGGQATEQFNREFFEKYFVFFPSRDEFRGVRGKISSIGVKRRAIEERHNQLWEVYFDHLVRQRESIETNLGVGTSVKPFSIGCLALAASLLIGGATAWFTQQEFNPLEYEREVKFVNVKDQYKEIKEENIRRLRREITEHQAELDGLVGSYNAMVEDEPVFIKAPDNWTYNNIVNSIANNSSLGYYVSRFTAVGDPNLVTQDINWVSNETLGNKRYDHSSVINAVIAHALRIKPTDRRTVKLGTYPDIDVYLYRISGLPDSQKPNTTAPYLVLIPVSLEDKIRSPGMLNILTDIADTGNGLQNREKALERFERYVPEYKVPED